MDSWNTFSFPFGALNGLFSGVNSLLEISNIPLEHPPRLPTNSLLEGFFFHFWGFGRSRMFQRYVGFLLEKWVLNSLKLIGI